MTILQRLATPKPFVRLTRADYEKLLDRLYEDRDRAAHRPPRPGWSVPSRPRDDRGVDGIARTLWEAS